MPINKNQLFRYKLLNICLADRNNAYSIEGLRRFCNSELLKNGFSGISIRTIRYDLNVIESEYAEIERYKAVPENEEETICYRYKDPGFSIPWTNEEDEKIRELRRNLNKMQDLVAKLEEFEGVPMFDWISEFKLRINELVNEPKKPIVVFESGNIDVDKLKFLNVLYKAIIEHKTLAIRGHSFEINDDYKKIVSPYMLKQYNCRWYLICKVHNSDKDPDSKHTDLECLPLDRIDDVCDAKVRYEMYEDDVDEYFEDVIGVTVYKGAEPELIKLRVTDTTLPYILTRPLHGSQKQDKENKNIITLNVIVNYELKSKIRSFGAAVEVLEPLWLRDEFLKEAILTLNKYKSLNDTMSEEEKK